MATLIRATLDRTTFAASVGCLSLFLVTDTAFSQDADHPAPLLGSATIDQVYTPVTPCRFVDGINAADRVASSASGTTARYYRVRGSAGSDFVSQGAAGSAPTGCGIPNSATAVMVNLTVADPDADGDLRVDPADALTPSTTSVLNYTFGGARGKNLANGVVVKLCDLTLGACASGATPTTPTRDLLVTFHAGASPVSTYFIADVLGYFGPAIDPLPNSLPAGKTIRGSYNTGGTAAAAGALANTSISFIFTFASAPTVKIVLQGGLPPAECPGTVALPQAQAGYLCIFEESRINTSGITLNSVGRTGATIFVNSTAGGGFFSYGTWAATGN